MPMLNKSRINPQPHGGFKRFVSAIAATLSEWHECFCEPQKKQSTLQKGRKKLLATQKVTEGKITAVGTQIVSIAQISLKR